jgi:hypothetical protein
VGEEAMTFWWMLNVPGVTPFVFIIQAESIEEATGRVMHRMKSWYGEDASRRELMTRYLAMEPPKVMVFEDGIAILSVDALTRPQA